MREPQIFLITYLQFLHFPVFQYFSTVSAKRVPAGSASLQLKNAVTSCYLGCQSFLVFISNHLVNSEGKGMLKILRLLQNIFLLYLELLVRQKDFKKCFSMNCLYYIFVFLAIHGCGCYFIMVAFATWVTLKPAKCCAAIFFHCLHLSLISYLQRCSQNTHIHM